jgi:hypothetical protein
MGEYKGIDVTPDEDVYGGYGKVSWTAPDNFHIYHNQYYDGGKCLFLHPVLPILRLILSR